MSISRNAAASVATNAFGALVWFGVLVGACRTAAPPATASGTERLDGIASVCARITSCAHPHDLPRMRDPSACVDWILTRPSGGDATTRCLMEAADCAAVDRCLHETADPRAASSCGAHPGSFTLCEGNDLITCGTDDVAESTRVDCTSLGATCRELVASGGLLTHGCAGSKLCVGEETSASCDESGAVVSCHEGAVERTLCKDATRCRAHTHPDGTRYAMCEGEGHVECQVVGERRCDGDTLVTCEAHGHFSHGHATDCSALGLSCEEASSGAFCIARRPQCALGPPHCDGEGLTFCAAGRRVRVSCKALGFGPCDADARGPLAACTVAKGSALR